MSEESKQGLTINHEQELLIDTGLATFVSSRMPRYENATSKERSENIKEIVLPVVKEVALAFVPLLESEDRASEADHQQLTLVQEHIVSPLAETLNRTVPLVMTRKGDVWPDTYREVLSATGDEQFARDEADKKIDWSGWIMKTAQDLTVAVFPPQR